jgi:3-hydroxyacyl-CoA dehydrogenase
MWREEEREKDAPLALEVLHHHHVVYTAKEFRRKGFHCPWSRHTRPPNSSHVAFKRWYSPFIVSLLSFDYEGAAFKALLLDSDSNPEQTNAAKEYIDGALGQVISDIVHDGKAGSLRLFSDRDEALKTSWIVVEAVPEVKQLKIDLLGELDSILPLDVILATNSSSYTPSELNAKVTHRNRLISTHYYMPPSVLALEVMPIEDTHPDIAPLIMKEATKVGLKPYHVRKESVGLIANRIWAAIKRECLYVASQGIAEPAEIDALLKEALGFKVPPFQLMDSVGLDVVLDIEQHYQKTRPGQCPPEAAAFAESYVKQGKLGVKSGEGFYKHPKDAPHAGKDQLIYLDIIAAEVQCITTDGAEVKTLVSGLPHTMPDGVQFDSRPGKSQIYWTAMGKNGKDIDGTLWRANLDGTEVKKIVTEGQTHTPKQLTLDAEGEKLYWCDREGGRIQRADLDGSSIETLYDSSPGASRPLQDTTAWCVGITIDKKRGLIYWTQKGGSKGFVGRIFRANTEIPQGSSPGNRTDIQMLFENLPEPIDLDIDTDKQIIYCELIK